MRLLYVSHSFPPSGRPLSNVGGMQRVATELYNALSARTDLSLSALVLRSSWRWTHVRVAPFMVRVLWRLHRLGRTGDVDVVLFSSMVTAALAIPFRRRFRRAGIRTATIVHGRDVTLPVGIYQRLVRWIFGSMDLILPISKAVQQECLARGARREQIRRIPNGINLNRYDRPAPRALARARLIELADGRPLPEAPVILCSVGRQVQRKGFRWFVEEVLPILPDNVVYFLGGEGPERDAILASALRKGVSDRLFLLGRVAEADLSALYRGSDVFVMPNVPVPGDMEGFGVVMLEAGLNGLPTVAAALEGITDVIAPGVNGQLVKPLDAEGFAEAIEKYVEDRGRLEIAASRASAHVRDTFAWDAIAERYYRTLAMLLPFERKSAPFMPAPTSAHAVLAEEEKSAAA